MMEDGFFPRDDGDPFTGMPWPAVNDLFSQAHNWTYPRDPFVLDLDGDGIEAVGINSASPVLFDMDADGVKTGTGWIKADDGLLVFDRNGNGLIDSGRELFGDQTILQRDIAIPGLNYGHAGDKARNGFEALDDLDSNGDHVINSSDAIYGQLRVWQDANQDGISQGSELKTLADLGIASIGTSETNANRTDLGNGNTQVMAGSFTRTNGTTGQSGVAELSGSLLLASNNFYREFTDDPVVTADAAALPQMGGSGWVRDLREAMSLSGTQADALEDTVEAFAAATTRDAQMALIDELLQKWGATSGKQLTSIHKYNMVLQDGRYVTTNLTGEAFGDIVLTVHAPGMDEHVIVPDFGYQWVATPEGEKFYQRLNVLEAFNGTKFLQMAPLADNSVPGQEQGSGTGGGGEAGAMRATASLSQAQVDLLNKSYDALVESVYSALALQTRLRPYLDAVQLVIDETGIRFDTTPLDQLVQSTAALDPMKVIEDLIDLKKYATDTLSSLGWTPLTRLGEIVRGNTLTPAVQDLLAAEHIIVMANGATSFTLADDANSAIVGTAGSDTISLRGKNGVYEVDGGAGDDVISAQENNSTNTLIGGAGNDTLSSAPLSVNVFEGGTGNDTMNGLWKGDTYKFNLGDGQDVITDYEGAQSERAFWNLSNSVDRLVFGSGISPSAIVVTRSGTDLLLKHVNGSDQITVKNWFNDRAYQLEKIEFADGTSWTGAQVSAIALEVFGTSGGDVLSGTPMDDVLHGRGGNDTITGGAGTNILDGGDGDDVITAEENNSTNTLIGGAGNDTLSSSSLSINTFEGGVGNDVLNGMWKGDTYIFNLGDGQDTISDYEGSSTDRSFWGLSNTPDRLVFGASIAVSDIKATRSGNDLVFKHINGTDQVTVKNWFNGTTAYQIESIEFADGTVWTAAIASTEASTVFGTAGNDTLAGSPADDVIRGLGGNDTITGGTGTNILDGGDGDDVITAEENNSTNTLIGGAGNDTLSSSSLSVNTFEGGVGNDVLNGMWKGDTYIFNLGDGQDTISDYEGSSTDRSFWGLSNTPDRLVFGANIAVSDIKATRSGNDLVFKHINGTDQVTVKNWFNGTTAYQIESIQFANGTTWTAAIASAEALTVYGTAGADTLAGSPADDVIRGLGGNDTLSGGGGTNVLDGGDGDDIISADDNNSTNTLIGGAGNDTLSSIHLSVNVFEGGTGNDILNGLWKGDTYKFNLGDGQDTITDYEGSQNERGYWGLTNTPDRLIFGSSIAASDIKATRSGNDMVFKHVNGTDQVTVKNWFNGTTAYQIESIEFANGTVWTAAMASTEALTVYGTAGNDTLTGSPADDVIRGLGGNDTITGGGGTNILDGGDGDDVINADDNNSTNTLIGGAGNDTLSSTHLSVNVFEGGAGNDVLNGLWKGDTYKFNLGDGQDTITDYEGSQNERGYWGLSNTPDRLVFGASIAASDIKATRSSNDMVFKHINGTDQVTVKNWFNGTTAYQIESIEFADGTTWSAATASTAALTVYGTVGNDTLTGSPGDDVIYGLGGNDTITGGAGTNLLDGGDGDDVINADDNNSTNTLIGGAGNDTLSSTHLSVNVFEGGTGNDVLNGLWKADTYKFNRGDGQDTVTDYEGSAYERSYWGLSNTVDVLQFGANVTSNQLWFQQVGSDLEVSVIGTDDKVTIKSWYTSNSYHLEQIKTSDGKTLLDSDVNALVQAMASFSPPAAGQTMLPTDYQTSLTPAVAANWH